MVAIQRKPLVAVAMVVAILIAATIYYRQSSDSPSTTGNFAPPPVVIAVSTVRSESWSNYINAVGSIRARRGVELSAAESGEVTAVFFQSGDNVTAGQLLVKLNDRVEQANLRINQASLDLAKLLFDRDAKLVTEKSISQTQFDRSRADLQRAQAQLAETEARIANKQIRAPFSGAAGIRQIDVGDYVSPGTAIATLQDLSELEIDFPVPARFAPLIKPGMEASLQTSAWPDTTFTAIIAATEPKVDLATRNLMVNAHVKAAAGLLPGMFCQLQLALGEAVELTTVPETAITYSLNGDTIYVIEKEAASGRLVATARTVQPGQSQAGRVAILDGLKPGERVVTAGQNKLYPGATITIDEAIQL